MNILYYLLPLLGGLAVSLQVVLNGVLEGHVGRMWTVFTSHIVGAIAAIAILAVQFAVVGESAGFSGFKSTPWYSLFGGIFGFTIVFFVLIPTGKIPFTAILAFVTIGQLLFGAFADHFGIFGFDKSPLTIYRVLGICAIILGGYLVKK